MMNKDLTTTSEQFLARIEAFRNNIEDFEDRIRQRYRDISKEKTPEVDGTGLKIIDVKDKYDYIVETYMRDKLDYYFPGWSWEDAGENDIIVLGSEWILVKGHLVILDPDLLLLSMATNGVVSPYRRYRGVGAQRVAFKRDAPHTPENVIDIDKNVKSANSAAFKYSINRMCRVGDDVYRKRLDWEGAGTFEEVIDAQVEVGGAKGMEAFSRYVEEHKLSWGKVIAIVGPLSQITSSAEALAKVKEAQNGGKL